ncbi:type IV toxin-antitoxin system AbiEi family antitoxin domain-containing protein [Cellulomonas septica]|uniref:AbiEi antitoxin N-terminal domain-containing protein n=1 Tax=Cellulomonas septica TaxID=285080 RepID=A0ABX1JZ14_9CELL|nr:type IV toxin-antitoxin system AbiEi family antitoxin domain-containing protein [Cellulomonas septica]NKY39169.1 hypothetical protein [Cellulomonas septica]
MGVAPLTVNFANAKLMVMSGLIGTAEAAARLGLSRRQVNYLVAAGELRQVVRGALDATSVDRYAAVPRTGRQAWSEPTAWAAIALLTDHQVTWLGPSQLSRLRGRLRELTPERLVERCRDRASVHRYAAHRSTLPRIGADVVTPDRSLLGLAARADSTVDGYVARDQLSSLVHGHGLTEDEDGLLTLRATAMDIVLVAALAGGPVLAAVDSAGSLDARERRAGLDTLERVLERHAHA